MKPFLMGSGSMHDSKNIITRQQAVENGLSRYYTGKPCKRGHYAERHLGGQCVECKREYESTKQYKLIKRAWDRSERNKQSQRIRNRRYKEAHKDKIKRKAREYDSLPHVKEKKRAHSRRRAELGLEKQRKSTPEYLAWRRAYDKKRLQENPNERLATALRIRLLQAIKGAVKTGSAVKLLGCTVDCARQHIETQFKEGMHWGNYGEWHIDHKTPLSWFDLSIPEELEKACHYSNLQPLWREENISKGNRFAG